MQLNVGKNITLLGNTSSKEQNGDIDQLNLASM